jgi:hypothetical protein
MEMQEQMKNLIKLEIEKLVIKTQESLGTVKSVAIAEAWKILQLAIAATVQIIETIGTELSSPDKKTLAMDLLSSFYDKVFLVVDIPVVPNLLEPIIHRYVKAFIMILVGSTIDAMVTTFRNTGVFFNKKIY